MNTKTKLICDLDGVLVDTVNALMDFHNVRMESESEYSFECQWDVVKATNIRREEIGLDPLTSEGFWDLPRTFWRHLPWYTFGQMFLETLESMGDVYLATSPTLSAECVAGRYEWLGDHCPAYLRKHYVCADKTGVASSQSILIDDRGKNCMDFVKAGGQAILVPRPWNPLMRESKHPYDYVIDKLRSMM